MQLSRAWYLLRLMISCILLRVSGRQNELPRRIYTGFRQLGGVYIKFLQLLVVQSETFQNLKDYDMYDVYDQVTYDRIDVMALLRHELGGNAALLQLMSIQPFAAGSFGQVYAATYNNKPVVIKVLRPSVIKTLNFDLRALAVISTILDFVSGSESVINARQVCKELASATRAEVDYTLEADYAVTLHKRYQDHPHIVIPYTYRELSTRHIICQDYIGGLAATELLRQSDTGADASEVVRQVTGSSLSNQLVALGSEMLTSVFKHGSTYGDPHPGNIKFLPNDKIGLIDYGLQAYAPKNTEAFYKLIEQYRNIYNNQPDLTAYARALLNMYGGDIIKAAYSLEGYSKKSMTIIDQIIQTADTTLRNESGLVQSYMEDYKLIALFTFVINKNNRLCLRYDLEQPELLRATLMFMKLVTALRVNREVLQRTYNTVMTEISDYSTEQPELHPDTAFEIMANWLDQVSYKNPRLHRQIMHGGEYA